MVAIEDVESYRYGKEQLILARNSLSHFEEYEIHDIIGGNRKNKDTILEFIKQMLVKMRVQIGGKI